MERARTRNVRVGIDVGGTFTDVVAIDATTRELLARIKVPTTHDAREGVAAGIIAGIERLLQDPAIDAEAIAFVVGKAVGLQTGSASADYIQLYHGNVSLLAESLEVIQRTSAVILAAIQVDEPTQENEAVAEVA